MNELIELLKNRTDKLELSKKLRNKYSRDLVSVQMLDSYIRDNEWVINKLTQIIDSGKETDRELLTRFAVFCVDKMKRPNTPAWLVEQFMNELKQT